MAYEHLSTYLNDHSAGAAAAINLMQHLETQYAGTETAAFIAHLRTDVEADERQLQQLIERLSVHGGEMRKFGAWLTERFAQFKLVIDDPSGGQLRLLELLEVLTIGIEGKLLLWQSLRTIASAVPELQDADYEKLSQRARDQRSRLEPYRLAAAQNALVPQVASTPSR